MTSLESICADGTAPIKPCFIFSGVHVCKEWFMVDKDVLCVLSLFCTVMTLYECVIPELLPQIMVGLAIMFV